VLCSSELHFLWLRYDLEFTYLLRSIIFVIVFFVNIEYFSSKFNVSRGITRTTTVYMQVTLHLYRMDQKRLPYRSTFKTKNN